MTEPKTIVVDVSKWAGRNVWPLPSGELAVRPGLRSVLTNTAAVASASVKVPGTEEMWHYILDDDDIEVFDESGTAVFTLALGTTRQPRTATFAVLGDQIVLASPDFATHHAYIGSGFERARQKASVNPATSAIEIPRGLAVSWAGRLVIADGPVIYFSDPGEPRTFVGENAVLGEWGSSIYGLHVSAEGALVVCTESGVWALPSDAAAVGQVVLGIWDKLTDAVVIDYDTTCVSRGKVWALTQTGVRQVWPDGAEIAIDEPRIPLSIGARLHHHDYREGTILGGQRGPMVAIGDALWVYDERRQFASWWTAPGATTFAIIGLLQGLRGEEMLCGTRAVYRVLGNFDGTAALTGEGATAVVGSLFGRLDVKPHESPTVRSLRFASDSPVSVRASVRAQTAQTALPVQGKGADATAAIINTATWGGSFVYMEPPLQDIRTRWNARSPEPTIEVGATQPLSRLGGEVYVELAGAGSDRVRG